MSSETRQNGTAERPGCAPWEEASTEARRHALYVADLENQRARVATRGAPHNHGHLDAMLAAAYARHLDLMAEAQRLRPRARPVADL
jgi:hypothetical protein